MKISLSIVSHARQISGNTPIMQLHCISMKTVKLKLKGLDKGSNIFTFFIWWKPLGATESTAIVFPEAAKGYGWTAPPAQAAEGSGGLRWAPGGSAHSLNPVLGGGSPCRTLRRGRAYLSTQSTKTRLIGDNPWTQHCLYSKQNMQIILYLYLATILCLTLSFNHLILNILYCQYLP